MIVVTGAAGFIGSCLIRNLNEQGHTDILAVDDFSSELKSHNWREKKIAQRVERDSFLNWFKKNYSEVDFVFHIGARTDTTEKSTDIFDELNLNYSKSIWQVCVANQIPLVYASSAATYGMGEHGFDDNHEIVSSLEPLNPYGLSKNDFDKWVLHQDSQPPFWAGLKFFNVYGPNEYHKGRMASVIYHTFHQLMKTGKMKLFRSHHPDYRDGEQLRDFVYVKDVINVCYFLYKQQPGSGLYNLGTGQARSFLDLATATFKSAGKQPDIEFIDTPLDIHDTYQYFTEAKMDKLLAAGYNQPFVSLEEGIEDYVKNYLGKNNTY